MSAVCFCPSSLLSASDVGSSSTLIGYRGQASRVGALKVQISELRALARWARYCVYVRNYVQLPRLTPPTQRFNASTRVPRLDQWFPMQKCRFSTPLTRATRLVWPYHGRPPHTGAAAARRAFYARQKHAPSTNRRRRDGRAAV